MFIASLALLIFGGFLVFISLNSIATRKQEEDISSEEILDTFVLNGMISLFRDLRDATSKALKDRTQPEYAALFILFWGIILLVLGGALFYLAPEGGKSEEDLVPKSMSSPTTESRAPSSKRE
jgi:hypothetical protein